MATKAQAYLGIEDYKVVGTRPIRHDGMDKVTGRAIYGADVQMAGLLHGKVLRSPHAHARIKSIDTSRAEAHPGVKAVITGQDFIRAFEDKVEDLGEEIVRLKHLFAAVLATDKVLYQGFPVAAVAAINPHVAEEALESIKVDYEVLETGAGRARGDGGRRAAPAWRPDDQIAGYRDREGEQYFPAVSAQTGRYRGGV